MPELPEVETIRRQLPKGVDLQPFYDQSDIVNDSITSVRDAVLIGSLIGSPWADRATTPRVLAALDAAHHGGERRGGCGRPLPSP